MKKIFIFLLSVCLINCLFGCGKNESVPPETSVKVWASTPYDDVVADPKTWYDAFNALPIANDKMTTDELRQLCVDYFRLQLSFNWTPNKEISFVGSTGREVKLPVNMAYSGMLYNNNSGCGGGNLYKIVKYYNPETGVLDITSMKDVHNVVASHCSWGAMSAWNRVSNTAKMFTMDSYVESCGAIPVGPYTYSESGLDISQKEATPKIVAENGEQIMYQSYAAMLPGDGFYSSLTYHVEMCSSVPVVIKNDDGTINGEESYLLFCDQNADGTNGWLALEKQSDGTPLRTLGSYDRKATFKQLLTDAYLPFTVAEFLGTDLVEDGKAWIGGVNSGYENGKDISGFLLSQSTLYANYAIANVKITVKDPSGKTLLSYIPDVYTNHRTYSINLNDAYDGGKLSPLANGKNQIKFSVQLTTGEWVDAFETTLK